MEEWDALQQARGELIEHKVYQRLNSLENLQIFMSFHCFAVWDFMSLLKRLQKDLTCCELPWVPSKYSKEAVRFINEIVLCEESDIGLDNTPSDHFSLYREAMAELNVPTIKLDELAQTGRLPAGIHPVVSTFVNYHVDLAKHGKTHQVAAAFLFGREKMIPDMFERIVKTLDENKVHAPKARYYFQRHIEVDGDEHGPMAEMLLREICGDGDHLYKKAYQEALRSVQMRSKLWDVIATEQMRSRRPNASLEA